MQTMPYFLLTKFEQPLQILLWALIAFVLVKTWVAGTVAFIGGRR
jgi:hypothetical protein